MSIGYALRGLTIRCLSEPDDIDTVRMRNASSKWLKYA